MLFLGRNPLTIKQQPPENSPTELENSAAVHFYLKNVPAGKVAIQIADMQGKNAFTANIEAHAGINRYYWSLRFDPTEEQKREHERRLAAMKESAGEEGGGRAGRLQGSLAGPGTYRVTLTVGASTYASTVTVREDPDLGGK
jgi:hypothetical protein